MSLINEELVLLDYTAKSKDEVLQKVADVMEACGRLSDKGAYIEQLYHREGLASTAIGFSVAIPHGKTDAVKQATLMFLRLTEEIPWNDEMARLIFAIGVPESEPGDTHLKLLAQVARKIAREECRNGFLNATTPQQVLELVQA